MEYIINPSWFYWVAVFDRLGNIMIWASILLGILLAAICGTAFIEDDLQHYLSLLIKLAVAEGIIILAATLIPTRETLIEMQIAKLVTRSNIEVAVDKIKEITDYIITSIKSLN